jgi:hypothetical protein
VSVAIPIAKATLSEDATICKVICQISIDNRDLQPSADPAMSFAVTVFAANLILAKMN